MLDISIVLLIIVMIAVAVFYIKVVYSTKNSLSNSLVLLTCFIATEYLVVRQFYLNFW